MYRSNMSHDEAIVYDALASCHHKDEDEKLYMMYGLYEIIPNLQRVIGVNQVLDCLKSLEKRDFIEKIYAGEECWSIKSEIQKSAIE